MSRTLDLNKVSKAQRARKAWELLQEEKQGQVNYTSDEANATQKSDQAAQQLIEARKSFKAS